MSLDAVVARIDQIVTAQQQLATGALTPSAATLPSAAGALPTTAATPTSFAAALASAQATPPTDATGGAYPAGVVVPQASWNPQGKPIASWIVPVLQWASQHGWTGTVTSGYRSYDQQAAINASGAFSAPAGKSNHESAIYPGGAVDVSNPGQLLEVLKGYTGPQKLVGGVLGAADPEHFSANGH